MFLYYRSDKAFVGQHVNAFRDAFTTETTGGNGGPFSYRFGMKGSSLTISTPYSGPYGAVCSISAELLNDPAQDLLPGRPQDNAPYFANAGLDPLPIPGEDDVLFLTHYVMAPRAKGLFHRAGVEFAGMFVHSPTISFLVSPFDGRRYPLISPGGDEIGEATTSGIRKFDDSSRELGSFSLNGHVVELKNPELLHKVEEFGGHRLQVLKKLYMDGGEVGRIYRAELSWTTRGIHRGEAMFWYSRLFASVDDASSSMLGALFAFYHIKQYGNAVLASEFEPDTMTGPF